MGLLGERLTSPDAAHTRPLGANAGRCRCVRPSPAVPANPSPPGDSRFPPPHVGQAASAPCVSVPTAGHFPPPKREREPSPPDRVSGCAHPVSPATIHPAHVLRHPAPRPCAMHTHEIQNRTSGQEQASIPMAGYPEETREPPVGNRHRTAGVPTGIHPLEACPSPGPRPGPEKARRGPDSTGDDGWGPSHLQKVKEVPPGSRMDHRKRIRQSTSGVSQREHPQDILRSHPEEIGFIHLSRARQGNMGHKGQKIS